MKTKILLSFTLFILCSFSSFSQLNEDGAKKVEQLKIAFITNELNLSSLEAEKFWPIYNEMESKLKDVRKDRRILIQDIKENYDSIKEEEAKKKMQAYIDLNAKEQLILKEYSEKLSIIIGYKKTLKLYNVELEFKKELLKKIKENKPNSGINKRPIQR